MTTEALDHVAKQLKGILARMASVKPKTLSSVTISPYRNFFSPDCVAPKRAFTNIAEFTDHCCWTFRPVSTEAFTESLLSRLPRNAAIRLTHGDLLPKNIIVNGSTITGIIDWKMDGFYPAYWEYCRMHDLVWRTPGWDCVLRPNFPGSSWS